MSNSNFQGVSCLETCMGVRMKENYGGQENPYIVSWIVAMCCNALYKKHICVVLDNVMHGENNVVWSSSSILKDLVQLL